MQEENVGDGQLSKQRYCCDHAPECAVHQLPFDNGYVACTCTVAAGSLRHERVLSEHDITAPLTVQGLARTAQGALIALESGQSEVAARLLSDVVARAAIDETPVQTGAPLAKP